MTAATSPSPLSLVKSIRTGLADVRGHRAAAMATENLDISDRHWESFDSAVTPLVDALGEVEDRGLLANLENLLAALETQSGETK